jgi:thioredoxin reductase (NADPH)
MAKMRAQAERFGTVVVDQDVDRVDLSKQPFRVWSAGREFTADAVIVATGASAIWLGLESETRLRGRGVSSCATCDGFFFKGEEVAVVGGGDTALEEALFLTRFATKVHLLVRRDEFRGSKIMVARAQAHEKIQIHFNREVVEVVGEKKTEALVLKDTTSGATEQLAVGGLFVAIGHKPNTELLGGALPVDAAGYLQVKEHSSASAIDGIFTAGDVHDHRYRQAVTAAGDGCRAALDAERWLAAREA